MSVIKNAQIRSLVRSALKIIGTYVVATGTIVQGDLDVIVAGIATLAGVIWSHLDKPDDVPETLRR